MKADGVGWKLWRRAEVGDQITVELNGKCVCKR